MDSKARQETGSTVGGLNLCLERIQTLSNLSPLPPAPSLSFKVLNTKCNSSGHTSTVI